MRQIYLSFPRGDSKGIMLKEFYIANQPFYESLQEELNACALLQKEVDHNRFGMSRSRLINMLINKIFKRRISVEALQKSKEVVDMFIHKMETFTSKDMEVVQASKSAGSLYSFVYSVKLKKRSREIISYLEHCEQNYNVKEQYFPIVEIYDKLMEIECK